MTRGQIAAAAAVGAAAAGLAVGLPLGLTGDEGGGRRGIVAASTEQYPRPTGLCAGKLFTFRWLPVPGALKYRIYLDGKAVSSTKAPIAYRFRVPCGRHELGVSTVDPQGGESVVSTIAVDGGPRA